MPVSPMPLLIPKHVNKSNYLAKLGALTSDTVEWVIIPGHDIYPGCEFRQAIVGPIEEGGGKCTGQES